MPRNVYTSDNQPPNKGKGRGAEKPEVSLYKQLKKELSKIPREERTLKTNRTNLQRVCDAMIEGSVERNPQMMKLLAQVLGELVEKVDATTAGKPICCIPTAIPDEDDC